MTKKMNDILSEVNKIVYDCKVHAFRSLIFVTAFYTQ